MHDGEGSGVSRRQMIGGGLALAGGASALMTVAASGSAWAAGGNTATAAGAASLHGLPVGEIERVIRAKGTVSNGVLNIEISRDDLPHVVKAPPGVPIKPSFQINGNLCFQSLADGTTVMNGDLAFRPEELNPAIDQMVAHGLELQAMHQHLFDLRPMVWFMHMFARGSARQVAQALSAVLSVTSTPLPQAPPANPHTPLDVHRLSTIIGVPGQVGADGVVSFDVPRANPIIVHGVHISPFLNIQTPIAFQPLGGDRAVAVPDFGMTAEEVNPVMSVMRRRGWQVNCLYNQETAESPQLYFSHQLKVGNAYELAREIRMGLDRMDVRLS